MPYVVVQNYLAPPKDVSSSVPFSWRIKDYLEELWVQAQYITGAEGEPPGRHKTGRVPTPCHKWVIPVRKLLDSSGIRTQETALAEPFPTASMTIVE